MQFSQKLTRSPVLAAITDDARGVGDDRFGGGVVRNLSACRRP